ncbi:50S ribosomal protein L33 [Lactovum miscens]|nr:50S ribosomal protein L33 [Lactovum miscens]
MLKRGSLACTVCGSRNYSLTLSANGREQRLEVKKFCRTCNKHTLHKETR